jgi:hypothetical protein
MPDKQQYWCVQCDECDGAIPVLEYDPDKDRLNPQAFEAACSNCGAKLAYVEGDLDVYRTVRVPGFIPVNGFSNVERPD